MIKTNSKLDFHFLFSTFFGLGKTYKPVSIISASLAGIPVSYLILLASSKLLKDTRFDTPLYVLVLALIMLTALTLLAIHSSGVYAKRIKVKDPNEVVIDEVLGQSFSLLLTIPITLALVVFSHLSQKLNISTTTIMISAVVVNIILFRIFDSLKPWPISSIEKLEGGYGIMLDDIAAGFFAAIIYHAILFIILS
jgi:phosphatidylglycerophosphatase A